MQPLASGLVFSMINGVTSGPGGVFSTGEVPGWFWIVLLIVGTLTSVYLTFDRTGRRMRDLEAALAADVAQGIALLTTRIDGLAGAAPTGDAALALSDARERLMAAEELRAQSGAAVVLRAVRRTLLEGLAAVRAGDVLAGRDAGPVIPTPSPAPMTDSTVRVAVAGVEYLAQPAYRPGFAHHYSGGVLAGDEAPGGWYATAFWEELLADVDPSDS